MTIVTSSYHQLRGQVIYNAVGAIYRQQYGFSVEIVGNYCLPIESAPDVHSQEDRITERQLAQVLDLPNDALAGLKR